MITQTRYIKIYYEVCAARSSNKAIIISLVKSLFFTSPFEVQYVRPRHGRTIYALPRQTKPACCGDEIALSNAHVFEISAFLFRAVLLIKYQQLSIRLESNECMYKTFARIIPSEHCIRTRIQWESSAKTADESTKLVQTMGETLVN